MRVDSELVRRYRERSGMSRDDLAEIVGTTARTLQRVENEGIIGLPLLRLVCEVLQLPVAAALRKDVEAIRESLRAAGLSPGLAPTLVGRDAELAHLRSRLTAPSNHQRVLVLDGPIGVGKTSLAQRLAHDVADHFSDGVVWVRGDFSDVRFVKLDIARALGFEVHLPRLSDTSSGRDWRQAFASHLWSGRRLLVLDDIVDAAQVRAFSGDDPRTTMLVTTRFDHVAEEVCSERMSIGPLSDSATTELLAAGFDRSRLEQDRASFSRMLQLIGGMPGLACFTDSALRRERLTTLASWVARFESSAAYAAGDHFMQTVAKSYESLKRQLSGAAWDLFAALGLFGSEPVPLPWAAAAADGTLETIQGAASELLDCRVVALHGGPDQADYAPRLRLAPYPAAVARSLLGERVAATRARVVAHVRGELGACHSVSPHALSGYCHRHQALLANLRIDLADGNAVAARPHAP